MNAEDIKKALHELQIYFARRVPGWRERATPDQIQQHDDRVTEHDNLVRALVRVEEAAE